MKKLLLLALASLPLAACNTVGHSHVGGALHAEHVSDAVDDAVDQLTADRDGDTVPDRLDNCPDEAGSPQNNGCSTAQLVAIIAGKLQIKEKVFFATGSDEIESRSYPLLNNVAGVLSRHPDIESVRIEGHTDNTGDPAFNVDLSQRRAKSVMTYIVEKGVSDARLVSEGYGPDQPVDSNDTDEGRANNRRVEFTILGGAEG